VAAFFCVQEEEERGRERGKKDFKSVTVTVSVVGMRFSPFTFSATRCGCESPV
jgi:hypothetical protein